MELSKPDNHGIQLIYGAIAIFLLLFADDVITLSNTTVGLQNQLDSLKRETDRLYLTVNLENKQTNKQTKNNNNNNKCYGSPCLGTPHCSRKVVVWQYFS